MEALGRERNERKRENNSSYSLRRNSIELCHVVGYPRENIPLCKGYKEKKGLIKRFESFTFG